MCWSGHSKRQGTCAVGSFGRGAFGLVDMYGNVAEFTSSSFIADSPYSTEVAGRVYLGGSWADVKGVDVNGSPYTMLDSMEYETQDARSNKIGFRCAR